MNKYNKKNMKKPLFKEESLILRLVSITSLLTAPNLKLRIIFLMQIKMKMIIGIIRLKTKWFLHVILNRMKGNFHKVISKQLNLN